MTLRYMEARGIRLAYELSGPAEGPACVLIHGWTGSIEEWAIVVSPLHALGWRTLRIDGVHCEPEVVGTPRQLG